MLWRWDYQSSDHQLVALICSIHDIHILSIANHFVLVLICMQIPYIICIYIYIYTYVYVYCIDVNHCYSLCAFGSCFASPKMPQTSPTSPSRPEVLGLGQVQELPRAESARWRLQRLPLAAGTGTDHGSTGAHNATQRDWLRSHKLKSKRLVY